MKITFDTKAGDILANLLCEIDAMIEMGDVKVGVLGLSPDSAKYTHIFYQGLNTEGIVAAYFSDKGLKI